MAIDIRATVTCSLGPLISGSISDDYLQGNGLVRTKGSCELKGIYTPAVGTIVTFSYTQNGVARTLPRKLRVLSSFADPFRDTTKVELGCKLTYLQDLKEEINWRIVNDPVYSGNSDSFFNYAGAPIYASSLMNNCLNKLGITAASNPLKNRYSVAKFDLSPGYVTVLGNLLLSESYCGYLDENEVLQILTLSNDGGTGPVFSSPDIIDIGSIGVGDLPGEAVVVSYSSKVFSGNITILFQSPVEETVASVSAYTPPSWSRSSSTSRSMVAIAYTTPTGISTDSIYPVLTTSETTTNYRTFRKSSGDEITVVDSRQTVESSSYAAIAGSIMSQYLSNGVPASNGSVGSTTKETFTYDEEGNEITRTEYKSGDFIIAAGSMALTYAFSATDYVSFPGVSVPLSQTIVNTTISGNYRQVVTEQYIPWFQTIPGQQAIAESAASLTTSGAVSGFLNGLSTDLCLVNVTTSIEETSNTSQSIDDPKQLFFSDASDFPSNTFNDSYDTGPQSTTLLELAVGSPAAQRRIEFSLPYSTDDYYEVIPTYSSYYHVLVKSRGAAQANLYGRVQNKLLLGNRSGMNVQISAARMPAAPFSPVFVQAKGLTAMYRTNAISWTMDANGIVAASDLLFWGGVGQDT